jgi:hypothetical protein
MTNTDFINELEKFNEAQGQRIQNAEAVKDTSPKLKDSVDLHNDQLAARVSALPEWLRIARAVAITK